MSLTINVSAAARDHALDVARELAAHKGFDFTRRAVDGREGGIYDPALAPIVITHVPHELDETLGPARYYEATLGAITYGAESVPLKRVKPVRIRVQRADALRITSPDLLQATVSNYVGRLTWIFSGRQGPMWFTEIDSAITPGTNLGVDAIAYSTTPSKPANQGRIITDALWNQAFCGHDECEADPEHERLCLEHQRLLARVREVGAGMRTDAARRTG